MTRIELTITTDYLPTWGAWEGIRELMQNGKDAETEFNAPLKVDWYNDTVRICNEGAVLPHEALLLGFSSKSHREDLIGKFGEGLKLGILALVRAGHAVKIRSGSEVWIPSILDSEKFKAKVLTFDIQGNRKDERRVRVEVGGITKEDWENLKQRFLFVCPLNENEKVSTYAGDLLLGEKWKGKIFVKGIFVQSLPNLNWGYNFKDATLDRDRKMVETYDLQYSTRRVWSEAAAKRPDLLGSILTCLENETGDVAGVESYAVSSLPTALVDQAVTAFSDRYGKDAIPVANTAESKDIEHLGKLGVVVPKSLRLVLASRLGSVEETKEKLAKEVVKTYGWHELQDSEKQNVEEAMMLLNQALPSASMDSVDVVDFHDPKLMGMFKDSRVLLAQRILSDRQKVLAVLVHEFSHRVTTGDDGDKSHVAGIEEIWARIVFTIWK